MTSLPIKQCTMKSKLVAGIDVSKSSLDMSYNTSMGDVIHIKVSNDTIGFKKLLKLAGSDYLYVMECSGPYYLRLSIFLKEHNVDVSVSNGLIVKRFIQMKGERNKNDKKDSYWIHRFGMEQELKLWEIPSDSQVKSKQMLAGISLLKRQSTMLINQLHSFETLHLQDKDTIKSLRTVLKKIEAEINKLERKMEDTIKEWNKKQYENLLSIPGIGKRTASLLMIQTDGFKKVDNYRQLISMVGTAPREFRSGSSVRGKVRICKMGGKDIRSVMYLGAMSAAIYNPACKALYQRLIEKGKNGKLAMIAVVNKLLKQSYAIAKSGEKFDREYAMKIS